MFSPVSELEGVAVDQQHVHDNQRHDVRPTRVRIQLDGISRSTTAKVKEKLLSFTPKLKHLDLINVFYLKLRLQWMSDGVMSIRGRVKSTDRQRWSCRSSLTLCRVRSDRRGAPLHSLDFQFDSESALPFSASLCFFGTCINCNKTDLL